MKVVHVITCLEDGGAEAIMYSLCRNDLKNNHVVISLRNDGKYGPLLKEIGIEVYTLEISIGIKTFVGLFRLYKLLKQLSPDVIQTWMFHGDFFGGVAGRFASVKNIIWGVHHTTLVKGESKPSTILLAKINSFLSTLIPKKIIYCAKKSRKVQESIGFNEEKGVVISNGYDVLHFKPDNISRTHFRNELGLHNEFLIGNVGRYDPLKDHQTLLLAVKELKQITDIPFKFVIVGTGLDNDNMELKTLITEYGLKQNVILLGRRIDIPSVMNGLDLFVLSSVSEAFPNVLNEAMACGTPCVTTDVGDAAFIVGKTGWVVQPKAPLAMAHEIMLALQEKQKNYDDWLSRKQICRERIVDKFSIEKMLDGYHQVWKS